MEDRNRTMVVLFLVFVCAGLSAEGQTVQDVCQTCHANATCDDKSDGSGKVCNCKYGFVGNGRSFCQDKDECQIGSSKICGQHTTCHNTYGSYYCTCLNGYRPSNNMAVFIPNDGTHCRDIDECGITGLCGVGGQCRNLEGSYECRCQVGYRVHNGVEPFQPTRDNVSCKVVDCGQPVLEEDTVLHSNTGTTYGSLATFVCEEGFVWRRGDNSSVCGADGLWRKPTMVCEEILCGDPPVLPHTGQMWNGSSTPGSTMTYFCNIGFYHSEGNNVSVCTMNGYWTKADISCEEVDCGEPLPIPHSVMLWDRVSTVGSRVVYKCNPGYHSVRGKNVSVCNAGGEWDGASLLCQEINCQEPVFKPNAKVLWNGTSHIGSVVYYQCEEGYYTKSLRNYSVCGENGLWEDIDLWCQEITCGRPLTVPHTNLLWDGTSTPGSVVLYECMNGFYQESGNNMSTCSQSGKWGNVSIRCKAKCGPVPFLANSDVVWHNRSVVIHRCAAGYHSWRGSNVSVCGASGQWQKSTLRCIEIKPPINHLLIFNEMCLSWRAEKYDEDTEVYTVTYTGSRDYQRSFHDKKTQVLSSTADQLELCLNLLPVTNYTITINATTAQFRATITTNTSLPAPPVPVVYYREFETPLPTLKLHRSPNTLDPISLYQVFVVPLEGIMMFDCSSPVSSDPSNKIKFPVEYITAQIDAQSVGTEIIFTVGDGAFYGGFYNVPLKRGKNYYIILRAVSQWKTDLKSSCVVWAKVGGTSYVLKVSALSAAATIGLVALAILGGYHFVWFIKKT
ncbi:sushi domain-containing protein 1 isoform X2 [Mugil cephalus]|uniref:sushi domain-containing protein 1 isoform X2 n=1 Tax=Mugil cephalus TaxID=48193 RepID=UPI001FB5D35A|nr:sushi domain-containing protein 1 isoform X2 [Mugil cephalus]